MPIFLDYWQDRNLGQRLHDYNPSLYLTITRQITRGRILGNMVSLDALARGVLCVFGFGPVKRNLLDKFLAQHQGPAWPIPPRPRITRTTAEVLASLTPAERREVARLACEFAEIRAERPDAKLPPSPGHAWLMEGAGWVWNIDNGCYQGANE